MKSIVVLLLCNTLISGATLWNYQKGLHTTVIEQVDNTYLFRYNYSPEKDFTFPNLESVINYSVVYDKETFEYGTSTLPPIWGVVRFDNQNIRTYVPQVPEPNVIWFVLLGGLMLIKTRI